MPLKNCARYLYGKRIDWWFDKGELKIVAAKVDSHEYKGKIACPPCQESSPLSSQHEAPHHRHGTLTHMVLAIVFCRPVAECRTCAF